MDRLGSLIAIVLAVAVVSTILLLLGFFLNAGSSTAGAFGWLLGEANSAVVENPILLLFSRASVVVAPASWVALAGLWVWRGEVRVRWSRHGLDRDVFRLMVKTKGGKNRVAILRAMITPIDRAKLAKDLDLDWTTIDHHISVLLKYGLVQESAAYGNVRLYQLTEPGNKLLMALDELGQ